MENGEAPQEEGQHPEAARSTAERFLSDVLVDETLIHDWERQKIIKYLDELEINLLYNENRYKVFSIIIAFLAMFFLFFEKLIDIFRYYFNFGDLFFEKIAAPIYIFIPIIILLSFFVVIGSYIQSQKVRSEIIIANRRLSELNQAKPISPTSAGQPTVTSNAAIKPISETSMYFRDLLKKLISETSEIIMILSKCTLIKAFI